MPISLTREESAFKACEEAIADQQYSGEFERVWADFTPRGPISREEFVLRLEQSIAELRAIGDFSSNLTAHYMEQARDCAKTGDCTALAAAGPSGDNGALHTNLRSNALTYEGSGLASETDTGFVLLEYKLNNQDNSYETKFHFCRMSSASGHFSKGHVYLHGPVPYAEGRSTKSLYSNL